MGSAGQLLELIVSREASRCGEVEQEEEEVEEVEGEIWGRRKMLRRGRAKREASQEAVFRNVGQVPSNENIGGTLPRGGQKVCGAIQNNEKSCSAQKKNVATERTILESGGHQVFLITHDRHLLVISLIERGSFIGGWMLLLAPGLDQSAHLVSCQLHVCSTAHSFTLTFILQGTVCPALTFPLFRA